MTIQLVQNVWRKSLLVLVNLALLAGLIWNALPATPAVAASTGYVQEVDTGGWHTCALTSEGRVKCWGSNTNGELGDDKVSGNSSAVPVDVCADATCATSLNNVDAIATGRYHSCALLGTGKVKCWGYNGDGQLGDNSTTQSNTPVYVCADASCTTDLTDVIAITAGDNHTCALISGGGVKCWGNNDAGQLGDNNAPNDSPAPIDVCADTGCANALSGISAVAGGYQHTCAVTTAANAMCWGADGGGQLGNGAPYTDSGLPVYVRTSNSDANPLSNVSAIGLGAYHSCAVLTGGGIKCWGFNNSGQLGDKSSTNRPSPVDVHTSAGDATPLSGVSAVNGGYEHTCALMTNGSIKCWGANSLGQLGDDNAPNNSDTPVDVSGLAGTANTASAAVYHSCALLNDGRVKCWGFNGDGQLGDGTNTQRNTPVNQLWMTTYVTTGAINNGMCSGNGPCYASPTTALNFTVGNVTYSGTVNVRSGTYNESLTLDKNATVIFEANATLNGDLTQSDGTLTIGNGFALNGALSQTGGTMTIGTGFSLSGNLSQNGGMLTIADNAALGGSLTQASGTLQIGDNATLGSDLDQSDGTLTVGTGFGLGGNLSQTGGALTIGSGATLGSSLTQNNGTLALGNNIALSGALNQSGGTLGIGDGATLGGNLTQSYGTITIGADTILSGTLNQSDGTINAPTGTFSITGDLTRTGGLFNHNDGTIVFNGTGTQTLTGYTIFNNLTINYGNLLVLATQPAILGTFTNNGGVQETKNVGGATLFLDLWGNEQKYWGVWITPVSGSMGDTTVTIRGNQNCTTQASDPIVRRCFEIVPTTPTTATLNFHYSEAERNGQANATMLVYHWNATNHVWEQETGIYTVGGTGDGQFVQVTDVSRYSKFVLSSSLSAPTAIKLNTLTAVGGGWGFSVLLGFIAAFALTRRKR